MDCSAQQALVLKCTHTGVNFINKFKDVNKLHNSGSNSPSRGDSTNVSKLYDNGALHCILHSLKFVGETDPSMEMEITKINR